MPFQAPAIATFSVGYRCRLGLFDWMVGLAFSKSMIIMYSKAGEHGIQSRSDD
jgi:hypothetical protein